LDNKRKGVMAVVCDIYKSCVIFNNKLIGMKATGQIMRSKYCTDNFSRCICYMHSQGLLAEPGNELITASKDEYLDAG
jgi:hypothetical protein